MKIRINTKTIKKTLRRTGRAIAKDYHKAKEFVTKPVSPETKETLTKFQNVQRGSAEYLGQILPQKQSMSIPQLVPSSRPLPPQKLTKTQLKALNKPVFRKRVVTYLSSPALRI